MEKIRVSIIVPTRNRPDQIGPCVESILANGHPSMELIVVDQSDTRDSESALVAFRRDSQTLHYRVAELPEDRRFMTWASSQASLALWLFLYTSV